MSDSGLKWRGVIFIVIALILFTLRYIPLISTPELKLFNVDVVSVDSASKVCNTAVALLVQECSFINLINTISIIISALLLIYGAYLLIASDWIKPNKDDFEDVEKHIEKTSSKHSKHSAHKKDSTDESESYYIEDFDDSNGLFSWFKSIKLWSFGDYIFLLLIIVVLALIAILILHFLNKI